MAKRLFLYVALIVFVISGCTKEKKNSPSVPAIEGISSVYCDAELLSEDSQYVLSDNSELRLNSSVQRSDSIAHSGKYSLRLTKEYPYGFTLNVKNIKKNEIIKAGFWCYGFTPWLVFCDSGNVYYRKVDKVMETDSAGWKKIEFSFRAPGNLHSNTLRIYAYNAAGTNGYIDDFTFERLPALARDIVPEMLLKIQVDASAMAKLTAKREEALSAGILESDDADYVKMKLIYLEDTLKGSMRLKGDWLDHLQGDKWSFRIKLKSKYSWKGMKTFSLQTPESRSFLDEWLLHRLLGKEDILTTRYGFINVELNGQDMGVYAYEEHFDKYLVEYNDRREGPIVKFSEEEFWLSNKVNLNSDKLIAIPTFQKSVILPFKMNRTVGSPELLKQFEIAQNLMTMYREWGTPLENIFDLERLARFVALIDVTKGFHTLPWHNQRFYFNPVLCTLEPIAFDCYTNDGVFSYGKNTIFGDLDHPDEFAENQYDFAYQFFLNEKFRRLYIQYLEKYTDDGFVRNFLQENEQDIAEAETLLREEFFHYRYNDSFLLKNAANAREVIELKKEQLSDNSLFKELRLKTKHYAYDTVRSPDIPPYYIKAYLQQKPDSSRDLVRIVNNYSLDIKVIGHTSKDGKKYFFPREYTVGSVNRKDNTLDITIPASSGVLLYTVSAFPDIFEADVFPWEFPGNYSPRMDLLNKAQLSVMARYASGKKIIIPAGEHEFTEPFIIPEGYECEISAGASLNFTQRSFLLSYSPIKAMGKEDNKIIIRSGDGTSMGFIVLQAKGKSVLEHVVFDRLSNMNYNGWSLTGAVTFYESDVEVKYVSFINNRSEDALNIIRSSFIMKHCLFDNIFSDAFDSDFSKGGIEFSTFEDIKNDAVDFSGSDITIRNCFVKNAGDKGISSGERSRLLVENVDIANTNVAVASKDNSLLEIRNSSLSDSKYGYTAFNKKSEYKGVAILRSEDVKIKNVAFYSFIETGSLLILDGKRHEGTEENAVDLFY